MSKFRMSAEWDMHVLDEQQAHLIATESLHSLVAETKKSGVSVEGDPDASLNSIEVVVPCSSRK